MQLMKRTEIPEVEALQPLPKDLSFMAVVDIRNVETVVKCLTNPAANSTAALVQKAFLERPLANQLVHFKNR